MNDRYKYTCAFCENSVASRFDYCSTCNRKFVDVYGAEWNKLDWAQAMIQSQREMTRIEAYEYTMLDKDTPFERSSVISLDYAAVSADITGRIEDRTIYVLPDKRKVSKFDAVISGLVRQGLGARRIHATLVLNFGADKAPSFSTIQRRIREVKR